MISKFTIPFVALLATSASSMSGTPADFSIEWYTIDGGGGTSTGGEFSLSGTIGQHDAAPLAAQGGDYALVGGFWGGGVPISDELFRDGFEGP